jgi:hypothetical protein
MSFSAAVACAAHAPAAGSPRPSLAACGGAWARTWLPPDAKAAWWMGMSSKKMLWTLGLRTPSTWRQRQALSRDRAWASK